MQKFVLLRRKKKFKNTALVMRQPSQHLIEYMIVFLVRQRSNDAGLIQKVAVDLCPVQSAVSHLDFDEVTLENFLYFRVEIFFKIKW